MSPAAGADVWTLRLPPPSDPLLPGSDAGPARLRPATRPDRPTLQAPGNPVDLAAFRWLLGHQLAFGIWRLLADCLRTMAVTGPDDEGLAAAAAWYDRYSAVQVYAGSCTPQVYAAVIRRRMIACDPAFSGTWARDYEAVLGALGRLDLPAGGVVRQALRRHRLVHMTLAKVLVPEGESLWKQTGHRGFEAVTEADRDRFDAYFQVRREPVTVGRFRAQLTQRLAAARCDLAASPLAPRFADIVSTLPRDLPTCLRDIEQALDHRTLPEEPRWTSTSISA